MFLTELAEPTLLVIYPGRFQPFHKGHYAVYEYLTGKFGRNNVYIATSNKVESPKSPFTFSEKSYFMQLTGVPADRIIQATQPYQITSVLSSGQIHVADPANTVAIFAVSEKDMAEDPRFKSFTKKDGTPAFFQKMPDNIRDTVSMTQHAYIMTVPTFNFAVMGQPMQSGTELRALYVNSDSSQRQAIVKDLFGRYTAEAEQLLTSRLAPAAPAVPPRPTRLAKTAKPAGGQVAEPVSEMDRRGFLKAAGAAVGTAALGGLAGCGVSDKEKEFLSHLTDPADVKKYKELRNQWIEYRALSVGKGGFQYEGLATITFIDLTKFKKQMYEKYNFGPAKKEVKEAGGTGVVANKAQARDPRYSMSLTRDVRPGQIDKSLRAFDLAEDLAWVHARLGEGAVDALAARHIEYIGQDIAKIKERIATEKLPPQYVEKLKQKIAKLEQERSQLAFNPNEGA